MFGYWNNIFKRRCSNAWNTAFFLEMGVCLNNWMVRIIRVITVHLTCVQNSHTHMNMMFYLVLVLHKFASCSVASYMINNLGVFCFLFPERKRDETKRERL